MALGEKGAEKAATARPRLLVIDDDRVNRTILEVILAQLPVEIEFAETAREGLARAREAVFDLVVTDLRLPEVDGFEVARRIRAHAGPSHAAPIIACSADCDEPVRERCLAVGMCDLVAKPISPGDLLRCVLRWLPG